MRRILKLPTPKQAGIFFLLVGAFLDPEIYAAQGLTADSAILLTSSTSSFRFHSSLSPRKKRTDRPARVHRSYGDRFRDEDDVQGDRLVPNDEISRRLSTDRPTLSRTEVMGPPIVPSKPKIVVLGASGKVGRLVVQQLLESNVDMTVVAFVRDYDKACRVLYDDILVTKRSKTGPGGKGRSRGPNLQIVEADLVPPEELPGYEDEEETSWRKRAKSAASFYRNSVENYDDRDQISEGVQVNEALQEAVKGCTAIISCVGSVRPTNLWTDILERPILRLLRKDVSRWCKDARHPYYVNFASTRKALNYAEREQLRREAALTVSDSDDTQASTKEKESVPRIRFIRISDLCLASQPWSFVPLVTNTMHSMVFRYQDMAERLLEASSLIETVVLRPGDLVDEDRDVQTTSLQVCPSGRLPSPSRVGRDDVAALAVSAALFDSKTSSKDDKNSEAGEHEIEEPFHYTLAVRWAGEDLSPFPAQGRLKDGMPDANLCLQDALRKLSTDRAKPSLRRTKRRAAYPETVLRFATTLQASRRSKPYGVCVAVPLYLILALFARSLFHSVASFFPGQRWIRPVFTPVWDFIAMSIAAVMARVGVLFQGRLPSWKWVSWRANPKYISF
jgi:hypothetical protein